MPARVQSTPLPVEPGYYRRQLQVKVSDAVDAVRKEDRCHRNHDRGEKKG